MNKINSEQASHIWQKMYLSFQSNNEVLVNMDSIAALEVLNTLERILNAITDNSSSKE